MPVLERIFDLAEFAENGLVMLRGNADAGVCDREQHCRDRPPCCADTMTWPWGVNFSALEIRLRRICDTLPSSVCSGASSSRLFEDQFDRIVVRQQRLQHAFERAEEFLHFESLGADACLSGLDLGQIEQIVDHLLEVARRRLDEAHLLDLLCASDRRRSCSISRRARETIEFSGVRNSWETLERNLVFSSEARRR